VTLLPVVGGSQGWTLALVAGWGLAYGAMPLALQMWMAKAAPDAPEGGMALFVANFQASIALGSFVGGLVVDHLGVVDALSISGVLGVVALIVLYAFNTSNATAGAKA
jgi:predicted MFS family arabinose efflux permease